MPGWVPASNFFHRCRLLMSAREKEQEGERRSEGAGRCRFRRRGVNTARTPRKVSDSSVLDAAEGERRLLSSPLFSPPLVSFFFFCTFSFFLFSHPPPFFLSFFFFFFPKTGVADQACDGRQSHNHTGEELI